VSASDIRFDCRFCNKAVTVPAKYAGQRTKCPSCKNPVVVPGKQNTMAGGFTDAESSEGQLKQVSQKSISRGRSSIPLAKILMLAGLLAAAFFGWKFFKGQSAKPLGVLLEQYAEGNLANGPFIKDKINTAAKESDDGAELGSLKKYVGHKDEAVRAFIMDCMGLARNKRAFDPLAKALKKDKAAVVRRAAAVSLGSIKQKKVISLLIAAMKDEKDGKVKGGIRKSLVVLTGQKQYKIEYSAWNTWWDAKQRKQFVFPK